MNSAERAKLWAQYANAAVTERGRLGALAAALDEGPEVLKETLRALKLGTVEDALRWAWSAEKADRTWTRRYRERASA